MTGLKFDYPNGLPTHISPSGGTTVRIEVSGLGLSTPRPDTGQFHYDTGSGFETVNMEQIAQNVYEAVFPAADCLTVVSYAFSAEATDGHRYYDPRSVDELPPDPYVVSANYGILVAWDEPLDSDPGWATEGQWAFGQPTGGGGGHGYPDPTSGHTGSYVYGYNLDGDYTNSMPEYRLTSTALDCTGLLETRLAFWRWLGVERSMYDHAYIHISTDGNNWQLVWENPDAETADGSWEYVEYDISQWADGEETVYIRWTMGETDIGWTYCGWNIDDVQLLATNCTPRIGDLNCDNLVDFGDINPFVLALTDPNGYAMAFPDCDIMNADINEDEVVDFGDINPFVDLLTQP